MKCQRDVCHLAAALALVGWYLMVPPKRPELATLNYFSWNWNGGYDAPLSQWYQDAAYDSAEKCEAAKQTLIGSVREKDPDNKVRLYRVELSRCVESNDPRLAK